MSEQQDHCSNKKQKLNEEEVIGIKKQGKINLEFGSTSNINVMKLEGRMTLAAQQISSSTSMELEETPLMDLSQRVIGGAPS
ncbi:hypothetical protein LIER_28486 [Lithospermum erythrorhizon]|uniref:Uncharacterized protein n=1 Tax=Lithospermum erythrorhizon TaxID=34254 RepID=A0AAV3RJF6_LITER